MIAILHHFKLLLQSQYLILQIENLLKHYQIILTIFIIDSRVKINLFTLLVIRLTRKIRDKSNKMKVNNLHQYINFNIMKLQQHNMKIFSIFSNQQQKKYAKILMKISMIFQITIKIGDLELQKFLFNDYNPSSLSFV